MKQWKHSTFRSQVCWNSFENFCQLLVKTKGFYLGYFMGIFLENKRIFAWLARFPGGKIFQVDRTIDRTNQLFFITLSSKGLAFINASWSDRDSLAASSFRTVNLCSASPQCFFRSGTPVVSTGWAGLGCFISSGHLLNLSYKFEL